MKLVSSILVATDFSRASDAASRMASDVAQRFGASVHLLRVLPPGSGERDACSKRLDEMAQSMVDDGAPSVQAVLVEGSDPTAEIDKYAESQGVNVIMVGAGEVMEDGRCFLGSVAARLRRAAIKPVWIVKPDCEAPIQRILCPVDMQPASARALRNAIHFARRLEAQLSVLTVVSTSEAVEGPEQGEAAAGPPELRAPHLQEFDEFLRGFDFHEVTSRKIIRKGKPRHEVVRIARSSEADLIVMGSTGRTGVSRMLIGGVARRVAQEMPCSVITVRSEEPIAPRELRPAPEADLRLCASHGDGSNCSRFLHGEELLRNGLADEAVICFQACVLNYDLCVNAWQKLAESHARMGDEKMAEHCRQRAEEAKKRQHNQMIQDESRGLEFLHRRMFGI